MMSGPFPTIQRDLKEKGLNSVAIQSVLDENVKLIQILINHKKNGNEKEANDAQQILHKNLIHLATIADQTSGYPNASRSQNPFNHQSNQVIVPAPVMAHQLGARIPMAQSQMLTSQNDFSRLPTGQPYPIPPNQTYSGANSAVRQAMPIQNPPQYGQMLPHPSQGPPTGRLNVPYPTSPTAPQQQIQKTINGDTIPLNEVQLQQIDEARHERKITPPSTDSFQNAATPTPPTPNSNALSSEEERKQ